MPFLGVQPERKGLFTPEPRQLVGVSDAEAWRLNPAHRQVYNKLNLALTQGLCAAPCGVDPLKAGCTADTPLFIKPIFNLAGMSLSTSEIKAGELPKSPTHCRPGHFWCETLTGEQTSTDCLVLDGEVKWFAHTRASQEKNANRPVYWEVGIALPELEPLITNLVASLLSGYTGLCNVEMIGKFFIEAHLRGSNGFFELYDKDFFRAWVELVDDKTWVSSPPVRSGIVYSCFGQGTLVPPLSARHWIPGILDIRPDPYTQDRMAVIYAENLKAARDMRNRLADHPA